LDNLIGTDPAGYAGLEDDVDWHWKRIFAGAALTTLLGIGAELAAPENRQDGNRIILVNRNVEIKCTFFKNTLLQREELNPILPFQWTGGPGRNGRGGAAAGNRILSFCVKCDVSYVAFCTVTVLTCNGCAFWGTQSNP